MTAFHFGGAKASLWLCLCRKFVLQNVGGSERIRSQNRLLLGGVRIGMGCMNLVTVVSRYTRVPATLRLCLVRQALDVEVDDDDFCPPGTYNTMYETVQMM